MKTYLVKFKGDLNLYSIIAGNVIDAIITTIKTKSGAAGKGVNDVEMVSEKPIINGFINDIH